MKNIALTHPVSFAIAALLCLAGCGRRSAPLPRTYPVHGKATYENGAPVTAGLVQFQPQSEPSVTTAGVIRNDGAYSLATMRDGLRAEGAVAGPNRVFVIPAENVARRADSRRITQQGASVPTVYPTPYRVEPRDNEFNLIVERSGR